MFVSTSQPASVRGVDDDLDEHGRAERAGSSRGD
jgi:hypothetical protein